jgi:nicotinic acid mononucleotide adenylyltransferase
MPYQFIEDLNQSPWKGSICEIGFGVPFQSWFFSQAGASKTILFAHSPYNKLFQGLDAGERAISEEASRKLAKRDMDKIIKEVYPIPEGRDFLFSIACTGAHKTQEEVGESHGWITLIHSTNPKVPSIHTIHFTFPKSLNRIEASTCTGLLIQWVLNTILLKPRNDKKGLINWPEAIQMLSNFPGKIDVINSLSISIEEHLMLCTADNPLVYHNGQFQRVTDYLREYDTFYRGSFNPITKLHSHFSNIKKAMLEIDISNIRKGTVTLVDIKHRLKMIDTSPDSPPIMINNGNPYFINLYNLLKKNDKAKIQFIVGVDTFNDIVNEKYIPTPNFLQPFYKSEGKVKFLVLERDGYKVIKNNYSDLLDYELITNPHPEVSSSEARKGNVDFINPSVLKYIESHNLYK